MRPTPRLKAARLSNGARRPCRSIASALAMLGLVVAFPSSVQGHGVYHEMVEEMDREIAARPDDAQLYAHRAFLHLEHGDWKASLADADRVDRLTKEDTGVDLIRGRALAAGGQLKEAKAVLDRFVAGHPGNAVALMQRARVRSELGEIAEAADDLSLGMRGVRAPEPGQVFELVSFLRNAKRKDAAIEAIDAAARQMPGLQSLVDLGVEIEMELGRHDAALRRMDAAIAGSKFREPLLAKRAALLARAGRTRESIAAWKELEARIAAMPPLERGSQAMCRLREQSRHAIEALAAQSPR